MDQSTDSSMDRLLNGWVEDRRGGALDGWIGRWISERRERRSN